MVLRRVGRFDRARGTDVLLQTRRRRTTDFALQRVGVGRGNGAAGRFAQRVAQRVADRIVAHISTLGLVV